MPPVPKEKQKNSASQRVSAVRSLVAAEGRPFENTLSAVKERQKVEIR